MISTTKGKNTTFSLPTECVRKHGSVSRSLLASRRKAEQKDEFFRFGGEKALFYPKTSTISRFFVDDYKVVTFSLFSV